MTDTTLDLTGISRDLAIWAGILTTDGATPLGDPHVPAMALAGLKSAIADGSIPLVTWGAGRVPQPVPLSDEQFTTAATAKLAKLTAANGGSEAAGLIAFGAQPDIDPNDARTFAFVRDRILHGPPTIATGSDSPPQYPPRESFTPHSNYTEPTEAAPDTPPSEALAWIRSVAPTPSPIGPTDETATIHEIMPVIPAGHVEVPTVAEIEAHPQAEPMFHGLDQSTTHDVVAKQSWSLLHRLALDVKNGVTGAAAALAHAVAHVFAKVHGSP